MAWVQDVDLTVPRTDVRIDVDAEQLLVIDRPDAFSVRFGALTADLVSAVEGLSVFAGQSNIASIWISNAAGVGTAQILVI